KIGFAPQAENAGRAHAGPGRQGLLAMRVLVCGAGRVGYGIARELASEKNAVTVIDTRPELIDQLTTELDVRGVVGHGSHPDVLERAGAADADMIIAVTHSDEVNMVACEVAHALFSTPHRLA